MNTYTIFFKTQTPSRTICGKLYVTTESMQGALAHLTHMVGYRYEVQMIVVNRWTDHEKILRRSQVIR